MRGHSVQDLLLVAVTDRITMRNLLGLHSGQPGLYVTADLQPRRYHLRHINIAVDAADLKNDIDVSLILSLSIMNETRNFKISP